MIHRPGTSTPSTVSLHTASPAASQLVQDAIPIGISLVSVPGQLRRARLARRPTLGRLPAVSGRVRFQRGMPMRAERPQAGAPFPPRLLRYRGTYHPWVALGGARGSQETLSTRPRTL